MWVDTDYREDVVKELVLACGRDFGGENHQAFSLQLGRPLDNLQNLIQPVN